jgi:hypothetical protein
MNNYKKQEYATMAQNIFSQSIEERTAYIESKDPTGKVVAIEEIKYLRNVFNQILQERRDDTGAYTFDDIIEAYLNFSNEYSLAIANFK